MQFSGVYFLLGFALLPSKNGHENYSEGCFFPNNEY